MYTATAKQILSPVADAISQLIIINAEAESCNAAMPDLTDVAATVQQQAINMVQVGKSMMGNGDEQLQMTMPGACDQGTYKHLEL
jgi:vinculin